MATDFKANAKAPVEHRQAYAIEVAANALEGIHDELRNIHQILRGEALKRGGGGR
jgi:hypothetical protein